MKALTFLHSFEPGGVERVALRLVRRLRSLGLDAPLFMGRPDGALRSELADGLAFTSPRQPRYGSAWYETLWMIRHLPAEIRRQRPDVLFCAGSTYSIVAVAMKVLLGKNCPPVLAKISNDLSRSDLTPPARLAWFWWMRLQRRFVDRWMVIDHSIADELRTLIGPVDLVVIPSPAVDSLPPRPVRRAATASSAPRRYVAVGRLAAQKDFVTMLRAFALARQFGDHLTILGDGPHRKRLTAWARSLGIEDEVTFAGHVPDAAAQIGQFDTLLISSRYEGVPAVIIEALAAGLRIVATDCGIGVRSLLDNGALGRITASGDACAFAAGMLTAFDPPQDVVWTRMRAFTLDASLPLYVNAIAGLAAGPRRAEKTVHQTDILGVEA